MIAILLATTLSATPFITCSSGKSGSLQLSLEKKGEAYAVSSTDASQVNPRAVSGTLQKASKKKLDKRHSVYRFELQDGTLTQVNGIDPAHCQADQASARCAITALEVKVARGGARGPEDDVLSAYRGTERILMEDGGPRGCSVVPSKELTQLLKSRK